jgi:hypothetical protein
MPLNMACRFIATCAIVTSATVVPAGAIELITPSEAALPTHVPHHRGISRGPTLIVVSPSPEAGTLKSPVHLRVRFEPHGGATINTDSVLLTYMKEPAVDLTQRIGPYIASTGIDVEGAEVPPGTHTLRLDVADSNGRVSSMDFTFSVSK